MKSLLLFLGAVFISLGSFATEILGQPIGCHKSDGGFYQISVQGKIILNETLVAKSSVPEDGLVRQAVDLQLRHLMGFYKNTHQNSLNVALSAFRNNVRISDPTLTRYGADFQIDSYLPTERGLSSSSYVLKAAERGFVHSDDPAKIFPYSAELIVADCSPQGLFLSQKPVLPLDPYLSFWLEDKSLRQPRSLGPNLISGVSNCFSDDLASFGNADSNWFFWSPVDPKIDANKKQQKCQILGSGKIYEPSVIIQRKLSAAPSLTKDFYKPTGAITTVSIFGIIDQSEAFLHFNMQDLREAIQKTRHICESSAKVSDCMTAWSASMAVSNGKYLEPGTYFFLEFLKYLHSIVAIESMSLEKTSDLDKEVLVHYRGKFLDSKVPVDGKVYFGRTSLDYGPPATQAYSRLLYSALKDADLVSYLGHAGLGTNFKLDEFKKLWKRDKLPDFSRTKSLWVGIYNCEGFSHFGFDLPEIFKNQKPKILITETSGIEAEPKFPLAQLSITSQILDNKTIAVKDIMGRYVESRDFLTEIWLQ